MSNVEPPGEHGPHALYEAYQTSTDPIHRRARLRAILDCGPPADGAEIWLLLREVRALVAELCSPKEAERLLLDHAHKGGFLHYRGLTSGTQPLIDPRRWGGFGLSTHYSVDWDDSCVSEVRWEVSPYSVQGVVREKLQDYLSVEPLQTRLARLPLHDVLAMLHRHGLLPKSAERHNARGGPQVQFAGELMRERFPDDQWRTMGPGAVCKACEDLAKKYKKKLPRDSFARAMGRRR